NDITPLDARRVGIGLAAVAILVTGFVLVPIAAPSGEFSVPSWSVGAAPLPSGAQMADNLSLTVVNGDVIAHGYLLSGTVESVIATVGNASETLSGPALASFLKNSTWTVHLPNGNVTSYTQSGTFSAPASEYFTLAASASTVVTVTYSNTNQGVVVVDLAIGELCPEMGIAPITTQVTT
ncbi:MAG: hypothetical protein L3J91_06945, partial [Thermoplasmata archaeon]|nr:hypothetical protein [Thermoplasmata archaeon]